MPKFTEVHHQQTAECFWHSISSEKVDVLLVLIFYQRMESSFSWQIMNVGRHLLWQDTGDRCILCTNHGRISETFIVSSWGDVISKILQVMLCLLKSSSGLFNSYDTWAVEEGKHNSKHKSKYLPYALRHYGEYKQKLQAKSKFSSCL